MWVCFWLRGLVQETRQNPIRWDRRRLGHQIFVSVLAIWQGRDSCMINTGLIVVLTSLNTKKWVFILCVEHHEHVFTARREKLIEILFFLRSSLIILINHHQRQMLTAPISLTLFCASSVSSSLTLCPIYPTPPLGLDMKQGQFFKRSLTGLNSQFTFYTSCLTKAEELSLSYYLPIVGGRIIGFIPFPTLGKSYWRHLVYEPSWWKIDLFGSANSWLSTFRDP